MNVMLHYSYSYFNTNTEKYGFMACRRLVHFLNFFFMQGGGKELHLIFIMTNICVRINSKCSKCLVNV